MVGFPNFVFAKRRLLSFTQKGIWVSDLVKYKKVNVISEIDVSSVVIN
jgi:hypothetical protein